MADANERMRPAAGGVHQGGEDPTTSVVRVLDRALRELDAAGRGERACSLAAEAWKHLRHTRPGDAQRMNGVLHYLTRARYETGKERRMARTQDEVLDVRTEAPARRHEHIFETWDGLLPGTGFVLVNDHDPKPLYYQFAAEHSGAFTWDYLESGPEVWRVRIGRTDGGGSDA